MIEFERICGNSITPIGRWLAIMAITSEGMFGLRSQIVDLSGSINVLQTHQFTRLHTSELTIGEQISDRTILAVAQDANSRLQKATNGLRRLETSGITDFVEAPNGRNAIGESCYPDSQLVSIKNSILSVRNKKPNLLHIIPMDVPLCAAVAGEAFVQDDLIAYQKATNKLDGFSVGLVLHETGHWLGLPHNSLINCSINIKKAYLDPETTDYIQRGMTLQQQLSAGCDVVRHHDSTPDVYASKSSVMGRGLPPSDSMAFTPAERAILTGVQFLPVSATNGVYPFMVPPGEVSGLIIKIPEGHILRKKIDPTITELSVGIWKYSANVDNPYPYLSIQAISPYQIYDIDPETIEDGCGYKVRYTDDELSEGNRLAIVLSTDERKGVDSISLELHPLADGTGLELLTNRQGGGC